MVADDGDCGWWWRWWLVLAVVQKQSSDPSDYKRLKIIFNVVEKQILKISINIVNWQTKITLIGNWHENIIKLKIIFDRLLFLTSFILMKTILKTSGLCCTNL